MPEWQATAALTTEIATAAPDPSPSRRPRSSNGRSPNAANSRPWAPSADRCPARQWSNAPGQARASTAAAAVQMNRPDHRHPPRPRRRHRARHRSNLAPAQRGQHLQRGQPAMPRHALGPLRRSCGPAPPDRRRFPGPSNPRPARQTTHEQIAAAAVVLPIPISPTTRRSVAASTASHPARSAAHTVVFGHRRTSGEIPVVGSTPAAPPTAAPPRPWPTG